MKIIIKLKASYNKYFNVYLLKHISTYILQKLALQKVNFTSICIFKNN